MEYVIAQNAVSIVVLILEDIFQKFLIGVVSYSSHINTPLVVKVFPIYNMRTIPARREMKK